MDLSHPGICLQQIIYQTGWLTEEASHCPELAESAVVICFFAISDKHNILGPWNLRSLSDMLFIYLSWTGHQLSKGYEYESLFFMWPRVKSGPVCSALGLFQEISLTLGRHGDCFLSVSWGWKKNPRKICIEENIHSTTAVEKTN